MILTETQRKRIGEFLRSADQSSSGMDNTARRNEAVTLRRRLEEELRKFGSRELTDEEVETAIRNVREGKLGASQSAAPSTLPSSAGATAPEPHSVELDGQEDKVWLGVCAALAARTDISSHAMRLLWMAVGIFLPFLPLLLMLYLVFYFIFRQGNPPPVTAHPINWWALCMRAVRVFLIVVALWGGAVAIMELTRRLLYRFLDFAVYVTGSWNWLGESGWGLFFWVLTTTTFLGILSMLPLRSGWNKTVEKVTWAGLALYAVLLCFGVACFLTGVIITIAENFSNIEAFRGIL